jgi:hypothetical protein
VKGKEERRKKEKKEKEGREEKGRKKKIGTNLKFNNQEMIKYIFFY